MENLQQPIDSIKTNPKLDELLNQVIDACTLPKVPQRPVDSLPRSVVGCVVGGGERPEGVVAKRPGLMRVPRQILEHLCKPPARALLINVD
ncbi:MAG: hypothetical protein SFV24_16900 [Gemmatimonadales bacterium]|nr:hypothetical protein [Gemmatimonadales bacterium]